MVRTIAVARIVMPKTVVRLSAGRVTMSPADQAMCFLAGANSVFTGDTLLTTPNPEKSEDDALMVGCYIWGDTWGCHNGCYIGVVQVEPLFESTLFQLWS